MKKSLFLSVAAALAMSVGGAHASTINYQISVDTTGLAGQTGFIELQFNQANAGTSLSAEASVTGFTSTGFTFNDAGDETLGGVTGGLTTPPLAISNDVGAANIFDESVTSFGSHFQFNVSLSGPAIGASAPDGSGFYLFLLDHSFNPIVGPLGSGEIADIIVNPNGSTTPTGSSFAGGSASFAATSATPEPGTQRLMLAGVLMVGLGCAISRAR